MELLYQAAGLSRQAFQQWMQPSDKQLQRTPAPEVLALARLVRKKFLPGSAARELYYFIRKHEVYSRQLQGWGKHAFEQFCLSNGMRIVPARFQPKTTIRGAYMFPNLIEGQEITDIDSIWVSDISYIFNSSGALIGYATSLLDVYSRLLLGLHFSLTMRAVETSNPVLQQALDYRKKTTFPKLIFHSDGGKQYIETNFLKKLKAATIQSSMADNCYENPFAESFNDTLKNHILPDMDINSFGQLKQQQHFIKYAYNNYKVHSGIQRFTPVEFEQHILSLQPCQRTPLKIKVIT